MTILPAVAGAPAMPHSHAHSSNILTAAQILLPRLEAGERIDAAILRRAMETAIGASDASGAPAASGRPVAKGSSAPKTTSKAHMPAPRCASSTC